MRLILLIAAGLIVFKNIPRIKKAAVHTIGHTATKFDDLYSVVAKTVGQASEAIEDRIAESRYAKTVDKPNQDS